MTKKLIFATRPSALARWQTNYIIQQLQDSIADLECQELVITTKGDQVIDQPLPEIGGKGLFTFDAMCGFAQLDMAWTTYQQERSLAPPAPAEQLSCWPTVQI
jgi:hypothetical protein